MSTEREIETWRTVPKRPSSRSQAAVLVHLYPPAPALGTCYRLGRKPLFIGRGDECRLRLPEYSVSRCHARVQAEDDGYYVTDLESTNGTFVNDVPVSRSQLRDGDYLRVANCIFRFLAGTNIEAAYHEEIYRLILFDPLCEIPNKRHLVETLDRELSRTARHGGPLSLIMFDLDWFKKINDRLGHIAGDHTLREMSACVKKLVRKEDLFARYGGEEFALLLPETDHEGATVLAERVRQMVEEHRFEFEEETYKVTVSLGVATTVGEGGLKWSQFVRRADDKLYQAKREGRNRVVS
jgi:two-component system cell cycle response regulator